jgi:16S rRNA U516 pseudouridylate synthase RsuA-like enzyme
VITTIAQPDNNVRKALTAKTLPTQVERLGPQTIRITLVEGRNRQIRKMLGALNYAVVDLQRISFLGMTLDSNLKGPGDWMDLTDDELCLVQEALEQAQKNNDDPGIVESW